MAHSVLLIIACSRDKTVKYRDIARIVWSANPPRSKVYFNSLQCSMCNKRLPDELFTDEHAPLPDLLASHCNKCRVSFQTISARVINMRVVLVGASVADILVG